MAARYSSKIFISRCVAAVGSQFSATSPQHVQNDVCLTSQAAKGWSSLEASAEHSRMWCAACSGFGNTSRGTDWLRKPKDNWGHACSTLTMSNMNLIWNIILDWTQDSAIRFQRYDNRHSMSQSSCHPAWDPNPDLCFCWTAVVCLTKTSGKKQ
jgi:hypothetical protein